MVTLSELLDITDVGHLTIYQTLQDGSKVRLEVPCAARTTVRHLFGDWPVKRLSAVFKGDPRMVVETQQPEPIQVDAPEAHHEGNTERPREGDRP